MNFIEKLIRIKTGTYTTDKDITAMYFNSSNINMTKDQLTSFSTQLSAMGLARPDGIDSLLQNFSTADSNKDGKLSSTEVNAYLASQGLITKNSMLSNIGIGANAQGVTDTKSMLIQTIMAMIGKNA